MKKFSIKAAVLIPSLSALIAGVTIMAVVAGLLSSSTATDLTNQVIEAKIYEYTNKFSDLCGGVYSSVSAVTPIVADFQDSDRPDPRGEVIDILAKALMTNDNIIAMWTCWEPNAFDGKDRDYADASFYDSSGRFVPYLYKNEGSYNIEALTDYQDSVAGEYYLGARNSAKPYITDPYNYAVGSQVIPICSIAIPVIKNGAAVGVVGVDIDLENFTDLISSAALLGDGYMFALSPGGLVSAHPNRDMHLKSYTGTWMNNFNSQVYDVLNNGGKFEASTYSDLTGINIISKGIGVKIGDTGRYWLICAAIPETTVTASSVLLLETIIIIGLVLTVAVGMIIFLLFHFRLKGLPRLKEAAESIAVGNIELKGLDNSTWQTKNEITLLERSFGKMVDGIKLQADVMARIADGDYSLEVSPRSEKDVMNIALRHMLETTTQTLLQINAAADQVFTGSRQISDSSQSLAQGATEQASVIEELSTSVTEITAKTTENAKIAAEASQLSKTIKVRAEKGSEQMELMMQAVNDINDASFQIEKVIKAIDEIAFQTNILALNAAVEAARAGQHGKGFAVVAEEVRNLAAKSAESANDTGHMIENSKTKAQLGLEIADETAKSLKEIIDGVNRNADIVTQIEQATTEQAAAIMQINTGIDQVSEVIQQNSAASQQNAAASEEMNAQAETLAELTSRFTLN